MTKTGLWFFAIASATATAMIATVAGAQSPESQNAVTSIAIEPVITDSVYAGDTSAVYASENAGGSWLRYSVDPPGPIWSLAIDASRVSPVTSSYPWTYAAAGASGVLYTPDLGLTWVRRDLSGDEIRSVAARSDGRTAYAGGAAAIYRTDDRGDTWSILTSQLGTGLVTAIVLPDQDVDTIYVAKQGQGVYRSVDGGVTWQLGDTGLADKDLIDLDVDPANPSVLFATSATAIYQSVDAGTNWLALDSPPTADALAVDPASPNRLLAATSTAGLYRSLDGGLSWSAINNGLEVVTNFFSVAVVPDGSGRIYAGAADFEIFVSDNYGDTWQSLGQLPQPTEPPPPDVLPPPPPSASLAISIIDMQAGESVAAGSDARFRIELTNNGTGPAANVALHASWVLTSLLAGNDTPMTRSLAPSQGTCDSAGDCALGQIEPGQRVTVSFAGATRQGTLGTYRLTAAYWSDDTSRTSLSQTIGSRVTVASSDGGGGGGAAGLLELALFALFLVVKLMRSRLARSHASNT